MINNIKYISQYKDIDSAEWQNKSCSIVALYMAIQALQVDFNLTPDQLLAEGLKINGYNEAGFWKHQSLAILAHNHGLAAYTEEFKSEPFGEKTKFSEEILEYGVNKIYNFIKNGEGLVLVSVPKNFDQVDAPHTILIYKVEEMSGEKYFIYNDSAKDNKEEGENLKIKVKDFKEK